MADEDYGDDTYWNVSNPQKASTTGVTFDDESSEAVKDLALLKKRLGLDNNELYNHAEPDDSVETIDWSGARATFTANRQNITKPTATPVTSISSIAPATTSSLAGSTLTPPASSTFWVPGHQKSPSVGSVGATSSISSSSVSLENGTPIRSSGSKKDYSQADYVRLDQEYNRLKKKFEQSNRDKYRKADAKDTVERMKAGQPFVLEYHRTLDDKVKLLDDMLEYGDGDLIIMVLLFLKSTLNFALFQEQLLKKPVAADHYVAYLRDHYKLEELSTTLLALGRKEEAAMVDFHFACKKSSAPAKIAALKRCVQSTLSADPNLSNECSIVVEYVSLLERQQPIDDSDDKVMQEGKDPKFKQFPKTVTVVDQSVLTTLYYCCLYHYELPQNSFASPLSMREHHKLSDKQFVWIALRALARQKRWNDIQQLLSSKSFFGGSKIKSPVPIEKLLLILSHNGASPETLNIYIRLIDDVDRRLELAMKYKCHEVVVDCLVAAKDRLKLIDYNSKLTSHTKESYYAQNALQNSSNKWKN